MKRRAIWVAALLAAILCSLVIGFLVTRFSQDSRWTNDPTAERVRSGPPTGAPHWGEYPVALEEPPPVPPIDPRTFDSLFVSKDETSVTVTSSTALEPSSLVAGYTLHRVNSDQRFAINDGAFELKYVGIAYGAPSGTESGSSIALPGKFFQARTLEMLSGQEFAREIPDDRYRQLHFNGQFPVVQFSFALEQLSDFRLLDIGAYDARTKRNILFGGYSGNSRRQFERHFNVTVRVWHQTPVDLVVTIAHEPFDVFSIEPTVGQLIPHPRGLLKLIAIANGKQGSMGSRGNGTTNTSHVRLDRSAAGPWTTFVFASLTPSRSLPMGFEFFDTAGKSLTTEPFMGEGGLLRAASVNLRADDVGKIHVKLYRHFKRLVFRLPELPGLPPENRQVQNLFDVRIPFVNLGSDYNLHDLLENTLQMKLTRVTSKSSAYFPHTFTNVTAADLLDEYRRLSTTNRLVRIDTNTHQIEIKTHPAMKLWLQLKSLVPGKK